MSEKNPETKTFVLLGIGIFSVMMNFNKLVISEIISALLAVLFTGAGFYYAMATIFQVVHYWNRLTTLDMLLRLVGLFFMSLFLLSAIGLSCAVVGHLLPL